MAHAQRRAAGAGRHRIPPFAWALLGAVAVLALVGTAPLVMAAGGVLLTVTGYLVLRRSA